jgi:hypothetical protein
LFFQTFEPKYALWSDAATKRRWVYLPPGKQINTDQMDFWEFPEGTKLWKEFKRDGVLIEARLIMKKGQGSSDWYMIAYKWKADQKFDPIETCQAGHATGAALQGTISKVAKRVTPKKPQMSAIRELMSLRGDENSKTQLPPLGTEDVDTAGLEKVDAWINTL